MKSQGVGSPVVGSSSLITVRTKKVTAETDARFSGVDPLRLLIQTGQATAMQVSLLMFEISKLNRDIGGRGLRFEIDDVRIPRKACWHVLQVPTNVNKSSNWLSFQMCRWNLVAHMSRSMSI